MAGETRIEAARRRVRVAKRAVGLAATIGFAAVLALVRLGHPATAASSSGSASQAGESSSSLHHQQSGSSLGGGYLAPSSGSPPVASATS